MKHNKLSQDDIQSLRTRYSYNAKTGDLRDCTRNNSLVKSANVTLVDKRKIRAGRAIHAIFTGTDVQDKQIVRHIDGNQKNRVWDNLQVVEYSDIEHAPAVKQSLLPHLDFLRECFAYQPETGHLVWKQRPAHHFKWARSQKTFNKRLAGKRAGTPQGKHKRLQLHITSGSVELHAYTSNVIWALNYGTELPPGCVIDHEDGDTDNERLSNLRMATWAGNMHNSKSKHTEAGMRGIYRLSGKFHVKFVINNRTQNFVFSRNFEKVEEAKLCRKALEYKYHGQFAYEPVTWTPELQSWIDKLDLLNRANTRGKKCV
ncbi:HNH endonuclease [Paraburkholderia tropica]|uniref:HNH endonuclease n=1 Tax=Paraburkholderia tropica TaxID=92647 RepID=UPI002AB0A6F9|nr:HNH endonuclease [Paraburkholderia tropica]